MPWLTLPPYNHGATMREPWVSEVGQTVARQPENALASASSSSALRLLHSRYQTSTGSGLFVSVYRSRQHLLPPLFALALPPERPRPLVCDPDQVVLLASNGAVNRRGPVRR